MKKTKAKLIIAIIITILVIAIGVYFATKDLAPEQNSLNLADAQINFNNMGTYDVFIINSSFSPQEIIISKGDNVVWTNRDYTLHTVTSNSGTAISSRGLGKGETYQQTFKVSGTYNYHCSVNNSINGVVIVK